MTQAQTENTHGVSAWSHISCVLAVFSPTEMLESAIKLGERSLAYELTSSYFYLDIG